MYAQSVLQSLQAFSQRLMQQMANPVQLTEAHLALASILAGLLLILHITRFFSQPQFLVDFKMWVSVQRCTNGGRQI